MNILDLAIRKKKSLKNRLKNNLKNRSIKRNIAAFIDEYGQAQLPPREETFYPEVVIPCYNHGKYLEDA